MEDKPLNRVDVKFLELEVEALRKKLNLYQVNIDKSENLLQRLDGTHKDSEQEHLTSVVKQKHEIKIQVETILEENRKTLQDLNDSFQQFQKTAHEKSIAECGEIIFETKRLLGKYNTYMDFKLHEDRFKESQRQLDTIVAKKVEDFLGRTHNTHRHVQEQRELIVKDIKKHLINAAFQIGWKNWGPSTQNYIKAKMNNIGLQNFIYATSKQYKDNRMKMTRMDRKGANLINHPLTNEMIKKIYYLRKEIRAVTNEIKNIKTLTKKDRQSTKNFSKAFSSKYFQVASIGEIDLDNPDIEAKCNELKFESERLHNAEEQSKEKMKEYKEMIQSKDMIFRLATTIKHFCRRPTILLNFLNEETFQQTELSSFLDNVYQIVVEAIHNIEEFTEFTTHGCKANRIRTLTTPSISTIGSPEETTQKLKLFEPSLSSKLTSSPKYSQNLSRVVDVEEDPEQLNFRYEIEEEEKEQVDDDILHNEIQREDSDVL